MIRSSPPLTNAPKQKEVHERLKMIFPQGTENRKYVVNPAAARAIVAALYVNAVEGQDRWLAPRHVYRLTGPQLKKLTGADRDSYFKEAPRATGSYADNTREGIRAAIDRRTGLISVAAMIERADVHPNAKHGRYALRDDFAALFHVPDRQFEQAAAAWRQQHLTPQAILRIRLNQEAASASADRTLQVKLPNGEVRSLSRGPSAVICKAVIESFATKFLSQPNVLFVADSSYKLTDEDKIKARRFGIELDARTMLPDVLLVSVEGERVVFVFVESVADAAESAIGTARRDEIKRLIASWQQDPEQAVFVTAVVDRDSSEFKEVSSAVATGTYVWCQSEPDDFFYFGKNEGLLTRLAARRLSE